MNDPTVRNAGVDGELQVTVREADVAATGRTRFDRAAADRILDDLRHVAYRNGVAAARVFQFLDQDYTDADEDLPAAFKEWEESDYVGDPPVRGVSIGVQNLHAGTHFDGRDHYMSSLRCCWLRTSPELRTRLAAGAREASRVAVATR